jgi:hypothetical protein
LAYPVNDPQLCHNPSPTPFSELNDLLGELTERAAGILGDNFVGAYLQGSFAVGDADLHSDCDFLIPVRSPITPDHRAPAFCESVSLVTLCRIVNAGTNIQNHAVSTGS